MLITILTAGSRGDTQPYIALGLELKKAGYAVRIAASEGFASFIQGYGLDVYPMQGDVSKLASSAIAKDAMKADNPLKFFTSFNNPILKSFMLDMQRGFFNACAGSDAIIYHPGAAIGYFIAQEMQIPSILATPFPMTPTGDYPALIFYDSIRMGRGYNWLTHKIFENGFWMAFSSLVKQFWINQFGHAPEKFSNPFSKQSTQYLPTIISCSDHVFPRPADWPEAVHNTGYWFLEDDGDWTPPQDLIDFLKGGPAPVYVGFGSVGDASTAVQTTQLVMDALTRSRQRGVLATGWNGLSKMAHLLKDIYILESAPHTWLFPRMAAVVHHGGAGTTAAGFRAGVPSVIIPSGNDQFAWGRRVYELGVGSKPIPRKDLSAEKLAGAIQFALSQETRDAASALGKKIRSENGTETAVRIIENSLHR
jgi:sterol 3beta-glucosyltransferase